MKAVTSLLVLVTCVSASAQQATRPRARVASSPNLQATMQYIQDSLNAQGKVKFLTIGAPASAPGGEQVRYRTEISFTISGAAASAAQCTLSLNSLNESSEDNGERLKNESSIKLLFRDLESLEIDSVLDGYQRGRTQKTQWEVFPPVFVLHVLLNSGKTYHDRSRSTDEKGLVTETESETPGGFLLYFGDETEAERMSDAIERAAQLCGSNIGKGR